MSFYTYAHYKKDTGEIFYIGKGSGRRHLQGWTKSGHRSEFWKRTVDKHGFRSEILAIWPSEQEAFDHEKFLISAFKGMGASLVNLCDGGLGASGAKRSPEICELIGARYRGKKLNETHCKNISLSKLGTKQNPETVAKRIAKTRGQKRSEEVKQKLSAKAKQRSSEQIARAAEARSLVGYSDEHREKIRQAFSKPVICVTNQMRFSSAADAAQWLRSCGHQRAVGTNISTCAAGKRPRAYGHEWTLVAALKVQQGSGI